MKKVMIVTASPNRDGLTAACGEEAGKGCESKGTEVVAVRLNDLKIGMCKACDQGWGTCRDGHTCKVEDDFQELHASMEDVDGFIFITPVYWWDLSESAKAFLDRIRRCEAFKTDNQFIRNKPVICVAAAGGTGNGFVSCLMQMEKFVDHLRGKKLDFIGVTRMNREYKLKTIRAAAEQMAAQLT